MYDMEELLKRGDIVYWKPSDSPKTKDGNNMSVIGVYLETNQETGERTIVDCISWNGEWYNDGVVFTKEPLGIPPVGLKYKYWSCRRLKNNCERLLWKNMEKPGTDKEEGE